MIAGCLIIKICMTAKNIKENFSRIHDEKVDTSLNQVTGVNDDSEMNGSTVIPLDKPVVVKRRKAQKSAFGAFYATIHILGLLTSMGIGGLVIYYYIVNESVEHYAVAWARLLMGLPELGELPQADEVQNYVLGALACFFLGSFFQLTVVWQAYFTPRFLAKKPPLSVNFITFNLVLTFILEFLAYGRFSGPENRFGDHLSFNQYPAPRGYFDTLDKRQFGVLRPYRRWILV